MFVRYFCKDGTEIKNSETQIAAKSFEEAAELLNMTITVKNDLSNWCLMGAKVNKKDQRALVWAEE